MTVSKTTSSATFFGNGATTAFSLQFYVSPTDALRLYTVAEDGKFTPVLSGFSFVGNKTSETTSLTFTSAPAPNTEFYAVRETPPSQLVSLKGQVSYNPTVVEGVWDKLSRLIQELQTGAGKVLRATTALSPIKLLAGRALMVNSAGTEIVCGPSLEEIVAAEGNAVRAEDAADRAEVAASTLGVEACTFHPRDYIPAEQMVHILNGNTALQDETIVTAGLRAMHDAGMAWMRGLPGRVVTFRYVGAYAVNGEIFSETFAANLWTIGYAAGRFVFDGNGAVFQVKNWAALAAVRTSGMWAGVTDPVPTALFRWEQKTGYQVGPTIRNLTLSGTATDDTPGDDPIGLKIVRANAMQMHGVEIRNIRNIGRMMEGVVNSRETQCVLEGCGLQPTNAGGGGFISETVRFDVSGAAVVASEPVFTAAMTNRLLLLHGAGPNGHVHRSYITVIDSTHATLDSAAPTPVSDTPGSVDVLTGSMSAGSATLTLPVGNTFNFVGRYVIVLFAGSTETPNLDHLVTRVIAQSGSVLTLASPARFAVSGTPVLLAPSDFIGRTTDDYPRNGGREATSANDIQIYGQRNENPSYKGRSSAVNLFVNDAFNVSFLGGKLHGQSPLDNNFGSNAAIYIADNCDGLLFDAMQLKWGKYSGTYGSQIVTGQNAGVTLRDVQIGNNFAATNARHFYLAPRSSSTAWNVMLSGLDQSGNGWPNTNQGLVRYGPYGSSKHLTALGPLVLEGTPIVDNPNEPVTRHRSVRSASAGFGTEPTTTAVVAIGGASAYVPQEIWMGADRFLWRINATGLQMGKAVGAGAEEYPVKVNWDAAENSIILTSDYAQIRKPRLTSVPSYADNAAALAGGLVAGDIYKVSGTDPRQLAIVY